MSPTIPVTNGRQAALLAIVVVSSVLTLLLVCLRYVGRWKRQRRLDYSDLWIGIAEACLVVFHILIVLKVVKGGLGLQQEYVLATWGQQPILTLYKLTYGALAVIVPTFCLGKMSVLAVYAQLMPFTEMVLLVKISATLSILASVAIVLANLFLCSPPRHFWDSWADTTSDGHCNSLIESYFRTGLVNSVSDAFVILLPMPWLYKLRVPLRQKIFVITLFSLGIFIIGITGARLWYCTTLRGSGAIIHNYTHTGFWNTALCSLEGTATIAVACVPFLQSACVSNPRSRPPPHFALDTSTAATSEPGEQDARGRRRPTSLGAGLARLRSCWLPLGSRSQARGGASAGVSRAWGHEGARRKPGSLATATTDASQDLEQGTAAFVASARLEQGPTPVGASAAVVEDRGIIAMRAWDPRAGKESEDCTEIISDKCRRNHCL